jgi:hypothetical protein
VLARAIGDVKVLKTVKAGTVVRVTKVA